MDKMDIVKLAEALNLSKSTVSRAFRGSSDINPKTKQRILEKAKELNYRPNHYASNLREQKSKTIAVVIPELANNYFAQIIQSVERIVKDQGYHILIYVTDDDLDKEREFIQSISNGRVDGVVMSVAGESKDHSYLSNVDFSRLPIVFFDRVYDDIDLPKVVTDDYDSSYMATRHLLEVGCRRIAYLVVDQAASIGKTRMQGYKDALAAWQIPFNHDLVIDCSNSYEENAVILQRVLQEIKPDGIFASVERLAFSTYYVCQEIGVSIPQDLKVIAFSSLPIADLLAPSLSTVMQPTHKIGERAAQLVLKQIAGEGLRTDELETVFKSDLVVRKSTSI